MPDGSRSHQRRGPRTPPPAAIQSTTSITRLDRDAATVATKDPDLSRDHSPTG